MNPAHASLARSRAYALFSRLYLEGVTMEIVPRVQTVPPLMEALPDPFDEEKAAADHYDLLHLNVLPYASLFLDQTGQWGGATTETARQLVAQAGYTADMSRESADHVGHALGALAFLCGAEADAWEDGQAEEITRMQDHQRRFFDTYLLWWLPALAAAMRRHTYPFYTALSDLTLDLVLDHRVSLGAPLALRLATSRLPDPPALLDDARSGLKDIAAYLTTPAWSGLYLSRTDIGHLGRSQHLPRGFGDRTQMLANLLRAAVDYDHLDPLLAQLHDLVVTWQSTYTALRDQDVPGGDVIAAQWQQRLATTAQIIDRIREAVLE